MFTMANETNNKDKKITWTIATDVNIKRQAKSFCALQDISLSTLVERILIDFLKKNK